MEREAGRAEGQAGRVGPYVLGPVIGRGAAGVVHEAMDEKLRRKVALKILSDDLAGNAEARARFAREARLLAAVRHPNVAIVHGIVEEGEDVWLALEFLEGETLLEVLERGALPMEEALDVARQVAAGLEAAHECGVLHRDLKPANIKHASDGSVKVLDFGLAKPLAKGLSESSKVSTDGLVVGTPLYMAPEQLRGRPVDRRADIWAFGCLLWELLCGRRPFEAETTVDVLGAILEEDPDLERLPSNTPPRILELVERCLQKDPRQRLRDIGDARLELESALAERAWTRRSVGSDAGKKAGGTPSISVRSGVAMAALVAASLVLGLWLGARGKNGGSPTMEALRLTLAVPRGERALIPGLSPDGRTLVHEIAPKRGDEGRHLVARTLDSFGDSPIPGTERVRGFAFSPDGERLAVVRSSERSSEDQLVLVRLDGGTPPEFVCSLPEHSSSSNFVWLEDGRVVFGTRPRGLLIVETDGSERTLEVPVVCDPKEWPNAPEVLDALPGSGRILASAFHLSGTRALDVVVAIDLVTGEQTQIVDDASYAAWQPTGHLLFSRADVLFVASFDSDSLQLGKPEPIASGLLTQAHWASGPFRASREGSVVWWPGGLVGTDRRLSWVGGPEGSVPWSDDALPIEGNFAIDASGSFVTMIVSGPSGIWELWGSELALPNLRPLLSDPRYDYRGGWVILDRRELIACRIGPEGAEVRTTSLDDPDEGELLYRDDSNDTRLHDPRIVEQGGDLVVTAFAPEYTALLAFDLDAEPPLEPRTLYQVPRGTRVRLSSDGRWVLTYGTGVGVILRSVGSDGTIGAPVTLPTPGFEPVSVVWARDSVEGTQRILFWAEGTFDIHEIEMSKAEEGLRFSSPRRMIEFDGKRIWDGMHVEGDRFLAVLIDEDELVLDRVHLMLRAGESWPR